MILNQDALLDRALILFDDALELFFLQLKEAAQGTGLFCEKLIGRLYGTNLT